MGPDSMCVRSMSRMPLSGSLAACLDIVECENRSDGRLYTFYDARRNLSLSLPQLGRSWPEQTPGSRFLLGYLHPRGWRHTMFPSSPGPFPQQARLRTLYAI